MSAAKVEALIKKLNEDMKKLKLAAKEVQKEAKSSSKGSKVSKKSAKADKPKSINVCTTKAQLMLFTVAELKDWLIAKKEEKLSGLKKEDLVNKVLKKLKAKSKSKLSEPDSDSESGSESEDEFLSSSENSE